MLFLTGVLLLQSLCFATEEVETAAEGTMGSDTAAAPVVEPSASDFDLPDIPVPETTGPVDEAAPVETAVPAEKPVAEALGQAGTEETIQEPEPDSTLPAEAAVVEEVPSPPAEAAEPVEAAKAEEAVEAAPDYPGIHDSRPPLVQTAGGFVFDLAVDYQFSLIYINPISLNDVRAGDVFYGMQRGRTHWLMAYEDKVMLHTQVDLLDGVLFGDNGLVYGESPFPNEGIHTGARSPNNAGLDVNLIEGGDPNKSSDYAYGLKELEPIKLRRLWAEGNIIAGMLKVGRMPATEGRGILQNDGDNNLNRFGDSGSGDSTDRIQFGTKPIQMAKALISGDFEAADSRPDRGFVLGLAYDHMVNDLVQYTGDDTKQLGFSLIYKLPEFDASGIPGGDLKASFSFGHRFADDIDLALNILIFEISFGIENFHFESQAGVLVGKTKEISNAQSLFRTTGRGSTAMVQDIRSWGLLAIADYDIGPVTLTLEFDYASGDDDPRADSDLTQFYFAQDTKVGLLLFPQVLAYETARSAAAAEYFINQSEIPLTVETNANPSSQLDSGGGFNNAIALFPQVTWHITDQLFLRAGVLCAWADKPVIDPYETLHYYDGDDIEDDEVNFNGGKPGKYYGTEFDLRFSAKLWKDHFLFDLEGAILLPGDALEDANNDAVTSGLIQGRLTFRY